MDRLPLSYKSSAQKLLSSLHPSDIRLILTPNPETGLLPAVFTTPPVHIAQDLVSVVLFFLTKNSVTSALQADIERFALLLRKRNVSSKLIFNPKAKNLLSSVEKPKFQKIF